jgi:hypothetical protein
VDRAEWIARLDGLSQKPRNGRAVMMWRLVKLVLVLVILGVIGLTGYAYLGDLSPVQREVTQPVTLDAN